jgi:hypothetical protein
VVGKGPVRTGVTAILPLGKSHGDTPVSAAVYFFNGNGEMTGSAWVEESGFLEGARPAHQHTQRGRGARCGCRVGRKELSRKGKL